MLHKHVTSCVHDAALYNTHEGHITLLHMIKKTNKEKKTKSTRRKHNVQAYEGSHDADLLLPVGGTVTMTHYCNAGVPQLDQ